MRLWLNRDYELALTIGVLANRAKVECGEQGWEADGDPTEAALLTAGRKAGLDPQRLREAYPELGEVPFSSDR